MRRFYQTLCFKNSLQIVGLTLRIFLFFGISLNLYAGKSVNRIKSEKFKQKMTKEFMYKIETSKKANKGELDLKLLKEGINKWISHYRDLYYITDSEVEQFNKAYNKLEAVKQKNTEEKSAELNKIFQSLLKSMQDNPVQCLDQGQVCNKWACCDGMLCAFDPMRDKRAANKCFAGGISCKSDDQCCSGECREDSKTKKSTCEAVRRCYRPIEVGSDCSNNPVCKGSHCLPYNKNTSLLGECRTDNLKCSKNSDCCSNKCSSGRCEANFICKDCVPQGGKALRGKKCCEGLMKNKKNICIPDAPPLK